MKKPRVSNNNGSACIRFKLPGGNSYSLTGGKYGDPVAMVRMERIAMEIYEDVINNRFEGMAKYKTHKIAPTVSSLLEALCAPSVSPDVRSSLIKLLQPAYDKVMSPDLLDKLLDKSSLSAKSKRRYVTHLRSIFPQYAEYFAVSIKGDKTGENKRKPFTADQVIAILNAPTDHEAYWAYFALMLATGMRPSELLGLQMGDVDLTSGQIHIKGSLSRLRGDKVLREHKTTKTGRDRYLPMNPDLADLMASLMAEGDSKHRYVCSLDGVTPLDESRVVYQWEKSLKAAGVPYRPVYTCRHTFISHCLAAGIPVATVARWVGNSPDTIWKHYAGDVSDRLPPSLL